MTASPQLPIGEPRQMLLFAHDESNRLMTGGSSAPMDALAWMSAHIAAFDHAVMPVVRRKLPNGHELFDEERQISSRLARALRIVERHRSGDVLAAGLSASRLDARIADLVTEQRAVHERIVDGLEQALDAESMRELASSYERALSHAPTRPHPHLSHGGLMFRLDALRDRVLDTMDGRHVPIPRLVRRRIIPGRWGQYLIGAPPPEHRDAG